MGLFSKKKRPAPSGGQGWGDAVWDQPAVAVPAQDPSLGAGGTPLSQVAQRSDLIGSLEPLFLYICEQHRVVNEEKEISYQRVRASVDQLLRELEDLANREPVLRQHMEHLDRPLIYFVDYLFAAPECGFPFCDDWHENRIGFQRGLYGEDGRLAGDEAFFDHLDKALEANPNDTLANERLAFYYTCLGLGFTGFYFRKDDEDQGVLREYMQKIYPRISHLVDLNPDGKITPETYDYLNRRDFVAPARDRPLIIVAALISLTVTLLFGYALLYQHQVKTLEGIVENIKQTLL